MKKYASVNLDAFNVPAWIRKTAQAVNQVIVEFFR
jgi:hypothetical protein